MEHTASQRSKEWFDLRRNLVVTASRFADAVGVGRGKPYDFLISMLEEELPSAESSYTQHGIAMEPAIHEAYDLLTGYQTRQSSFWTIKDDKNPLKGKIGGSPDAIVLDERTGTPVGLCEFKAPVYKMYPDIPLHYMVQIQGQMAVTGLPWCDFMAVCQTSRQIMLKRVHFCAEFWDVIAKRLLLFCNAYQEANSCQPITDIHILKQVPCTSLPNQAKIRTVNLLQKPDRPHTFKGPAGVSMDYDLLLGTYTAAIPGTYQLR